MSELCYAALLGWFLLCLCLATKRGGGGEVITSAVIYSLLALAAGYLYKH